MMMISISFYLGALQAGTKEKTVPSVKILAIEVQFGLRSALKKLPGYLTSFPNLETLHVQVKFGLTQFLLQICCIGHFAFVVLIYLPWAKTQNRTVVIAAT